MTVEKKEDTQEGAAVEQVSKEQFDQLVAAVNELKAENGRLKEFNDKVIQEKRDAKAKADQELAEKDRQLEEKANKTKEESETLYKQYKDQNALLKQEIDNLKQEKYNDKVANKALELATKLNPLNDVAAKTLAKELKARIKLDDDGTIKVLDEAGNVTISPVDQLVNEFGTAYAFMCKGVNSTGGGSHSSATQQPQKKFSELSEVERTKLYQEDVNKYRELRSQELVK